ncbi:MAG: hypothetical protein ABSF80_07655 [Chitinispirillaceae bacterium]|jgi:hypothetical protein
MSFSLITRTVAIVALLSFFCFGQDSSSIKIVPFGHASMEWGQVVQGFDKNVGDIAHVAVERIYLGSGVNAYFSPETKFTGSLEVKAFNEFPRQVNLGRTRRYYYYFYLTQAELVHRLFDNNGLRVDVGGGYFPYKYDDNARNLGEYLFRSTAYPQTLTTEFDFPFARIAGLYARSSYVSGPNTINCDLIANINTEWMAIGDLNLTMIASYNYARLFELGAGVQFGSIISADESATTPISEYTRYLNGTDTSNSYTFRGTKLMGRFSFDPKKLIPVRDIFGNEDLKIYGEAALLGVKNYGVALHSPVWYNSILERIPVMLGFNFPTFKILDVLSLEGEWWGNRYPNSMEGIVNDGLPIPFPQGTTTIDSTKYKNDNLKWSIFGAKTFAGRYRISFQAASDHMRTFAWDFQYQDWEESLHGPKKWCYVLKFGVLF